MLVPWRVSINRVTLNFCSASGRQVISSLRSWRDRKLTSWPQTHERHNSNTLGPQNVPMFLSEFMRVPEKWIKSLNASLIFMSHSCKPTWLDLCFMWKQRSFWGFKPSKIAELYRFLFQISICHCPSWTNIPPGKLRLEDDCFLLGKVQPCRCCVDFRKIKLQFLCKHSQTSEGTFLRKLVSRRSLARSKQLSENME